MSNDYDYNENRPEPQEPVNNSEPVGASPESGAYRYTAGNMPGQSEYRGPNAGTTNPQNTQNPQGAGYQNSGYQDSGYQNTGYQNTGVYGQAPGVQASSRSTYAGGQNQPGYQPNMSAYNVQPQQTGKKSGGKRIIAIALVCALVGGLGGGAAVGMALKNSGKASTTAVEETTAGSETTPAANAAVTTQSDSDNANINTTVIDVKTNSETTEMTPQNVYEQYVNAVVAISNKGITTNAWGQYAETASSGSGFIISEDGYIVTNNHVVEGAQELTVIMTNGEEYPATIIGADSENDVALIKIDASGLPTVSIGSSDSIEVGEQVCAIGNPLGELTNTLTVGYISALDREINENGTPINMFQTDCAINAGNSGGPIFDMHGNVVGITTAKYSSNGSLSSASIEGIGFCVPINDAMDIVSDLLEYGYVKGRPSLGIMCEAISPTVTQYYNLPTGVYIRQVQDGSAASKAGLQEGDIITAVGGTETSSISDLKTVLKTYTAGETATLSIYRTETNETMEVSVTFDEKEVTTENGTVPG